MTIHCFNMLFFIYLVSWCSWYSTRPHWILTWHWSSGDWIWDCKNETTVCNTFWM